MKANKSIKNKGNYKSFFEKKVSVYLSNKYKQINYELIKIPYVIPESHHLYLTDFYIDYKGVRFYLETKGNFTISDRKKMLNIIKSNPNINLIMVFQRPENKINKKSKTTYSKWCEKNGIDWCSIDNIDNKIKEIYQRINNKILNNL